MIEIPLRLLPTEAPRRAASAWFIAGDDPHVWLDELGAWQIALDGLRLFLVPRTAADRRPCGVLAVPSAGASPAKTVRAEGYGQCSRRLYLPVGARFDPPAREFEIEAALLSDVALWHPCAGLVGFDESEGLSVADLLEKPAERPSRWDLAQPGTAAAPRLLAVSPRLLSVSPRLLAAFQSGPPAFKEPLAEWRDDIGSQGPDELPPAPQEPSESPLARLGRTVKLATARLALKLTAIAARAATAPTWMTRLENWASRQVARLGNALDAARRKEIDRLLHLLDTDPDRGLRYALPLEKGGHRGEGTPGTELPSRDLDFQLDRLGGGRPVDPWQVDVEQRIALRRRYRELANREAQLGRHRRAAYIFAELLDDVAAAAATLDEGGHDREAAILYRDCLGRPLDAARCFERGGAWDAALAIYEERQEFEKAAELLTRLERFDEATGMYRRAVEQWTEAGNRVRAARLLDEKLGDVDEAIELLSAGWPSSTQAAGCLTALFGLFGRLGRHDDARRWIARLRDERHPPPQLARAVGALANVARQHADPAVRREAADATRVVVGRRLPAAPVEEAALLVRAVRSLVPQDDLLGRDAARWLARRRQPPPARRRADSPTPITVVEADRFRLPNDVTYQTATAFGDGFIAAGYTRGGVAVVRGNFLGEMDRADWEAPLAELRPLLLAADADSPTAMIASIGGPAFAPRFLPYDRPGGAMLAAIGTPSWITPETLGLAVSNLGVWWTIDEQLLLTAMRGDGTQFSSQQFSLAELGVRIEHRDQPPERMAAMLARRDDVYLGIGHTLVAVKSDRVEQTQLKGWIRQLAFAPLVLHLRLAAGFEDYGAAVIWDDLSGRDVLDIADGLERPVLTFTLDGLLVAADAREGQVYSTSNRSVSLCARFDGPRRPIVGLFCGPRPGEFACLTEDGEVRCYRIE